ncbi:MAG TPA: PIG-L deacetylase family protein [Methylomirabilota bacterium]|nr:PIG-L deacetylase family protein [Methylomirabilota bacterium]
METSTLKPSRVLVIAAHPDDEVLGCGGALRLHKNRGDSVCVLIAAGRSEAESGYGKSQASLADAAAKVMGVDDLRILGLPDQRLDVIPMVELTQKIEEVVQDWKPDTVYIHHAGDVNRDHYALATASLVATRPVQRFIRQVFAFETISSTEWGYPRTFIPDTWLDISSVLDVKLRAMECYAPELRPYPHPRSLEAIKHRAHAWGNQCCLEAAEVFMTVRRFLP